jgi:F-type H+-transporting ATPase subunit b
MIERDMYISATKHDIVDAEKEMEKITKQLDQQESDIRAEANQIREKTELMGTQEADKIFASARKEISTLKEKNKKEIDAKIAEAKKDFVKESEELALNIMEKILDRRLSA